MTDAGSLDEEGFAAMGKPVLITGVAGFLGSHLADDLLNRGYSVRGIDNMIDGFKENIPAGVEFHELDCRDALGHPELFDGVELVYHCAAAPYEGLSVFSPFLVHEHTTSATVAMLSAAVRAGVERFVHCSSMSRYGELVPPFTEDMTPVPLTPYGIAKYAADLQVRAIAQVHGMQHNIAVPHNIIGPRQRFDDPYRNVAAIMINRVLRGLQPIIYGDGSQTRCFSFVSDVVSCLTKLGIDPEISGEIINVGPDEGEVTVLRLAQEICSIVGVDCDPIFMPARPLEVHHATCSSDKARRLLGYRTEVGLRDGLTEMVEWIQAVGPREFDYNLELEIVNELTPRTWSSRLM
ncbi:UDP-glucose 4-epimerase [Actinokineospora globicatena]|uniref:NAD-dependent epimerase/dehydratase family protein n=2 Tax=Actinokineospora globicatena TaxID=103729 RepID=UPI0020A40C36|nr:NAD-dependent epimerase/dehydratase family protein [Actinokineospora globicatena]MCP2306903.1 UDP-glucose 4-epimerase [Actinokineospora globicatena]GLW82346.1 GDP-mannose 4,6-dehydratase [Actinokineospora globicatena]GLW89061.1 GDP-mannose 4,6-dehydratase [Actinokineospora globicatena]